MSKDLRIEKDPEGGVTLAFTLVNDRVRALMFILFGLMLLGLLGTFLVTIMTRPDALLGPGLLTIFICSVLLIVGFYSAISVKSKAAIKLTADGIEFIDTWGLSLLNRRKREWSDVHSIQITYPESMGTSSNPQFRDQKKPWYAVFSMAGMGPCVSIDFISGGSATFMLSYLTMPMAEEFMSAIEKYGNPSKLSSDFVKMQKAIVLERLDAQSFTQLWSESLSPKYLATTYVPLPTSHELQDGRYKVLMELGAGGMSAVYLAKCDGKKVVLKESVLPHDIGEQQQEKARQLFAREASLLLKLKHPQIAMVLDRFVEEERDYLVLEYIPGLTLAQLVKAHGKQKEKDVLLWGRQLLEILIYLHNQEPPLLHRDLTPDNIVVKENKSIVLIDFGAANEFVGQATGTMIGKQCYVAPEQLRGKASQLSDLYSFGATMHYLLTAIDPEPLATSEPKTKCSEVSQALSDLVASLTRFEAEERPASAEQALKELDLIALSESKKVQV